MWEAQSLQAAGQAPSLVLATALREADAVLVGVGAGMGAADGFTYVGSRFTAAFPDFIEKYGWLDMFQASVHDFEDEAEEWAFFSRFVVLNGLDQPLGSSFVHLRDLLAGLNYHIITSNADNSFEVAQFPPERVYDAQGKYRLLQCARGCHAKRYPFDRLARQMVDAQEDMRVAEALIPRCPVCGGRMELNRRNHWDWMVEDEAFYAARKLYNQFLGAYQHDKLLLLELGCGFMAPQIIKLPFQNFCRYQPKSLYLTVNLKNYQRPQAILKRSIWLPADIKTLLAKTWEAMEHEHDLD